MDILDVRMPPEPEEEVVTVEQREPIPQEEIFTGNTGDKQEPKVQEVITEEPMPQPMPTTEPSTIADVEVPKPKKKRIISDKQKEHLKNARKKAAERRKQLKEERARVKAEVEARIKGEAVPSTGTYGATPRPVEKEQTKGPYGKKVEFQIPDDVITMTADDLEQFAYNAIEKHETKRKARKAEKNKIREQEKQKLINEQKIVAQARQQMRQNQISQNQKAALVQQSIMKGTAPAGDVWSNYCF